MSYSHAGYDFLAVGPLLKFLLMVRGTDRVDCQGCRFGNPLLVRLGGGGRKYDAVWVFSVNRAGALRTLVDRRPCPVVSLMCELEMVLVS